jgi:hypothetical protein
MIYFPPHLKSLSLTSSIVMWNQGHRGNEDLNRDKLQLEDAAYEDRKSLSQCDGLSRA